MKKVQLNNGQFAIIDKEDFDLVSKYKWYTRKNTRVDGSVSYSAVSNIDGCIVGMHNIIMDIQDPSFPIDHISCNSLDNRRCNLRIATVSQNQCNKGKRGNAKHKYKGIMVNGENYSAGISYMGKKYHLGTYQSEVEAAKAYDAKAKELHGEFARLNFPSL